jgi:hypothetical protein
MSHGILGQLLCANKKPTPSRAAKARKKVFNKPWLARQQQSEEKYRKLLSGKQLSTIEVAEAVSLTPIGCYQSLYKMQKRGLVVTTGRVQPEGSPESYKGKGPLIWTWATTGENNGA